jgi:ankyrin repeat protein
MKIYVVSLACLEVACSVLFVGCSSYKSTVSNSPQVNTQQLIFSTSPIFATPKEERSEDKGLLEASSKCDYELAKILLNKGANPVAKLRSGFSTTTPLLNTLGIIVYPSYYTDTGVKQSEQIFELFLSKNPDLNVVADTSDSTFGNYSLLHTLAKYPNSTKIKLLLDKGANPNVRIAESKYVDKKGFTPLMEMIDERSNVSLDQNSEWKKSFLLLAKASDINTQSEYSGFTSLMVAIKRTRTLGVDKGDAGIVAELLKLGAKTDIKNKAGKTAIDLAMESGSTEIVKLLDGTGSSTAASTSSASTSP